MGLPPLRSPAARTPEATSATQHLGLVADARTLVDHARVEAQNHRFTYDEAIGVEALTQGECFPNVQISMIRGAGLSGLRTTAGQGKEVSSIL